MNISAQHRGRMLLCLAIVYLVWGSSYLATSIGVHVLPPLLFGGVRFVLSGLMLYGIARALGSRARVTASEWRHVFIVGLGTVFISNGCNTWAMQWVASNQAALLNASPAFWIPLFGMFGARAHAVSRRVALGLLAGFAGTALVVLPRAAAHAVGGAGGAGGELTPTLVILFGCLAWSLATIYLRNVRSQLDILTFTALQMLCGGIMMLLLGFWRGDAALWSWSGPGLLAMAYMAIFSSCLGYTAYAWLTKHSTPSHVASYAFVNPAIATVLGWWVLNEQLSTPQVFGMTILLVGVMLVIWPDSARLDDALKTP